MIRCSFGITSPPSRLANNLIDRFRGRFSLSLPSGRLQGPGQVLGERLFQIHPLAGDGVVEGQPERVEERPVEA